MYGIHTPDKEAGRQFRTGFHIPQQDHGGVHSPMHQLYSSPLGAAIHAAPMNYNVGDSMPLVPYEFHHWKISPKVDKDLQKFDGKSDTYRVWWNRIRDHLCSGYLPWGRLLEIVEKTRDSLSFKKLSEISDVDGAHLDLPAISRQLWCFLGARLGDSIYTRRVQLAGGEDQHGLELWRNITMGFTRGC